MRILLMVLASVAAFGPALAENHTSNLAVRLSSRNKNRVPETLTLSIDHLGQALVR
jgi:hypothetical protein